MCFFTYQQQEQCISIVLLPVLLCFLIKYSQKIKGKKIFKPFSLDPLFSNVRKHNLYH